MMALNRSPVTRDVTPVAHRVTTAAERLASTASTALRFSRDDYRQGYADHTQLVVAATHLRTVVGDRHLHFR